MTDDYTAGSGAAARRLPAWAIVVMGVLSIVIVGMAIAGALAAGHAADERRALNDRVTALERTIRSADLKASEARLFQVEACLQVLTQYVERLHWNPPASKGAGQTSIPDRCETVLYGAPSEAPSRP